MYLAQTLQTQLGVLRILHERYKLSNRALHLSDDILYGEHYAQRDTSMQYGGG